MKSESMKELALMDFTNPSAFLKGQILLVDKPLGWTSFDVVNKLRYHLRRALGIKKIKVGHAGTLDPLATGVLVICTGRATKSIESLQSDSKTYEAGICLGATTPCLDAELPVDRWTDAHHLTLEAIRSGAQKWTGKIQQMPPLYSAKKVDGQKAYAVARKGGEINLKPAEITVSTFEITSAEPRLVDGHPVVQVNATIDCTKGTYIRALARDLGKTLEVGGYLTSLKRTRSGSFELARCASLEAVLVAIDTMPRTNLNKAVDL